MFILCLLSYVYIKYNLKVLLKTEICRTPPVNYYFKTLDKLIKLL
jgi:hypothetical protein